MSQKEPGLLDPGPIASIRGSPLLGDQMPELSPGGLSLLGDSTDLLHHAEGVIVDPLFLDFAT